TIDHNSIIRNKIRDFIGSKKWSVSRFASRYVEAFIELYSRHEAPSTSTARKLVEEDGHIYTEREVTVLDNFTKMDFYQTWLEGEKAKLIEKTNRYLGTDNGGASIDSPSMLRDSIAKLSNPGVNITLDDIDELLRRFVALDSSAPFILRSPSRLLMQAVLRNISPKYNVVRINPEDAIQELKTLIKTASVGEKSIGWLHSDSKKLQAQIEEIFGKDILTLRFGWSNPMAESLFRNSKGDPKKREWIKSHVIRCLKVREDWTEMFRNMIEQCVESAWVKFPDFERGGQLMAFIESKYQQFMPVFENNELKAELLHLMETQIPEDWLMDDCDPITLLRCRVEYKMWKDEKEKVIQSIEDEAVRNNHEKALQQFEGCDYFALMLWGNTKEIEQSDWIEWFEDRFRHYLVDWNFPKLFDISYTIKMRREK
ncbi:MAG: hypothetical protein NC453_12115, partial [Muribaculum sp.]|nr:hypothetical protein [Muribaculum sp.]